MLNVLSKIKGKLWRILSRRGYFSDLDNVLSYPHDHSKVDDVIKGLTLNDQSIISGEEFEASIDLISLKARYKYFNSINRFSVSLLCYREILFRESKWTGCMRGAGLRKKLMASFLLSEENKKCDYDSFEYFLKMHRHHDGYDKNFKDFVVGKRVALVGGAPSDKLSGDLIDQFDLVVRINTNSTRKFDQRILGTRCDIVYVRGERGQLILDNPEAYFSEAESNKIVYRFKIRQQLIDLPSIENTSLAINFDEVFDYGHLNAVQAAVLDLLVHGVMSIKVFNVDFNLSGAAFSGYRPSNLQAVQFEKIFVAHPPHPQFDLCKKCFLLGLLSGDEKFESIIKDSLDDFIVKCDVRWSLGNR